MGAKARPKIDATVRPPAEDEFNRADRDFVMMVMEWAIPPGTARPNPSVMTDFNLFTFNSRVT